MTALLNHFSFEFGTGLRNRSLLLLNYIFPLGFFLMMGAMMGSINPIFIETMIPAMIAFAVLSGALLGMPNPLVEARESGIFRSYKINGIPRLAVIGMPALTTSIHSLIAAVVITATANPLFKAPLPVNWPAFILVAVVTAFASAGLGVLIGVISANTRVTILWTQLIYLPSMMLSGMMVPLTMLPETLGKVSRLLPTTYAMQAFQGLAYQKETVIDPTLALITLIAGGLIAFALAYLLFTWDNRNAERRLNPWLALLALAPYALAMFL